METENKAREYALKVLEDEIQRIEDAYRKGFDDASYYIAKPNVDIDGVSYEDMGFKSKTYWTPKMLSVGRYFKRLPYGEALKYGLPTREQFEEMFERCIKEDDWTYLAPTGKSIRWWDYDNPCRVWVKSDVVDDKALVYELKEGERPKLIRIFTGAQLCFFSVKSNDIE